MIDRTYTDQITPERDGTETQIVGHVHELRDLGGILFVLVRDGRGVLQVVTKEDETPEVFDRATTLDREDVVHVRGTVSATEQAPGGVEEAMHEATLQGLFRGFPNGSR